MKLSKILMLIFLIVSMGIESCSTLENASEEEISGSVDLKNSTCASSDAINKLPWLNEQYLIIKDVPNSGIILYEYNSKNVIEIQSPLMSSTNLSQYYCDGTKLQFDTPETYSNDYKDFRSKAIKVKILWGVDFWKL